MNIDYYSYRGERESTQTIFFTTVLFAVTPGDIKKAHGQSCLSAHKLARSVPLLLWGFCAPPTTSQLHRSRNVMQHVQCTI